MFNQKEKGDSLQHNQIAATVEDLFDFWVMEDEGSKIYNQYAALQYQNRIYDQLYCSKIGFSRC